MLYLGFGSFYAKIGEELDLYIYSGNGGYAVSVDDESVLTASESNNIITINPIKLGKATITVTDSEQQQAQILVHVLDPYMALGVISISVENKVGDTETKKAIQDEIAANLILQKGYLYDLTKVESKPFVEYNQWWNSSPETEGTYEFSSDSISFKTSEAEFSYAIEQNDYGKMFYDYFVSNTIPESLSNEPIFELNADLTEKYKEQYPEKDVTSVKITAKVQAILYRATAL